MILGFTGTRKPLTSAQEFTLYSELKQLHKERTVFLHGGAESADEFADSCAKIEGFDIEVYPCNTMRYNYWRKYNDGTARLIYEIKQPLLRNHIIARRCDTLIACPAEKDEQLRSGTWATIRYARQEKKLRIIICPDGETIVELS